jgi:hypothetical protein
LPQHESGEAENDENEPRDNTFKGHGAIVAQRVAGSTKRG